MGVNLGTLVEYTCVYPDGKDNLNSLITGIPRDIILKAGATFLTDQTLDKQSEDLGKTIHNWFNADNSDFKDDLIQRITKYYPKNVVRNLMILSPITSLKLLQIGFSKSDAQQEKEKDFSEIERDLFKAYLLLNDSITHLQTKSKDYISDNYPAIKFGLMFLNISFASSDLVNFIYAREFFCQSVKGMFLYGFLKNETSLKLHLEEFLKKYCVNSFEDYRSRLMALMAPLANKQNPGFIEYLIKENEEFITRISVQDYSLADDVDFRIVRSAPLVKTGERKYRVTHPIFITDKFFKSFYFDLSKINDGLKAEAINNFRRFYTTNFSEKYLLYEVLKYILEDRYIQFTGAELDQMKIQGAPDYYVRNGNTIFLIENKDVLIKAQVKENPVFEDIEAELKKKFLEDDHRGVGIKQIARNVEKALSLQNTFDKNYKAANSVIYPILVVHDIVYDTAGLNTLFNEWFSTEMTALKKKGHKVDKVKPLIVLSIDTLIRAAGLLRINKFSLRDMLDVYLDGIKMKTKKVKTDEEMMKLISDTFMPSTKVIENWLNDRYAIQLKDNGILDYAMSKMN